MAGLPKGKDTKTKTGGSNVGSLSIPAKGGKGTGKTEVPPKKRNRGDALTSGGSHNKNCK